LWASQEHESFNADAPRIKVEPCRDTSSSFEAVEKEPSTSPTDYDTEGRDNAFIKKETSAPVNQSMSTSPVIDLTQDDISNQLPALIKVSAKASLLGKRPRLALWCLQRGCAWKCERKMSCIPSFL
jgi:hypothetical protein